MHKYILSLGLLILLVFLRVSSANTSDIEPKPTSTEVLEQRTMVLVELFTSQGCSSCPPADRVLHKLDADARTGNFPVVALSYHVDYWNRLGWKDPYSSAEFSQRQRNYASKINDQGVYTPQLVIQGKSGHVGSREREIRSAITKASQQRAPIGMAAKLEETEEETVLSYVLSGEIENATLNIAMVEKELNNAVSRGENRGRQLSHTNVVRQLITIEEVKDEGRITLPKQTLSTLNKGKLVLFVQDRNSWEVGGVTALDLDRP